MTRKVFYSFHFKPDNWRVSQIRNIGKIEDNKPVSDNKWEEVIRKGDKYIQNWIDENMLYRTCTIVLIGENTANRKWINYEICKSWNDGKGILGIYIHNLKNNFLQQANKGANPFEFISIGSKKLSSIVKCYNPPYSNSKNVYNYIATNIEDWVEEAIEIRKNIDK